LRLSHQRRMRVKEMMLLGILGLAHGDHPRLIEEKLRGFLTDLPPQDILPGEKVRSLKPRPAEKAKSRAISARSSQ